MEEVVAHVSEQQSRCLDDMNRFSGVYKSHVKMFALDCEDVSCIIEFLCKH